jgi:DNA-binding MarR family transcriptional regulator
VSDSAGDSRADLTEHVLQAHEILYRWLFAGRLSHWLDVDLTMVQLKTLLIVVDSQGATVSQLARGLEVTSSTVTGVVDRLAHQGLVARREDPTDRRVNLVEASTAGLRLANRLYFFRLQRMRELLACLDDEELAVVREAADLLTRAARPSSSQPQPERGDGDGDRADDTAAAG